MSTQPRQVKVFVALLLSMTACALVLMALGNNPPSAGAFCLSSYYSLDPVEQSISSPGARRCNGWDGVEIYYYTPPHPGPQRSAAENPSRFDGDSTYHFVVRSSASGADGRIRPTELWKKQYKLSSDPSRADSGNTIRICIMRDDKTKPPTDLQIIRTEALVEGLCRKFEIEPLLVHWPGYPHLKTAAALPNLN